MPCSHSPEHDAVYGMADEGDGRWCIALEVPGDYEEIRKPAAACRPEASDYRTDRRPALWFV
jgi:hypothetical protein